jgi:hypothetical protein
MLRADGDDRRRLSARKLLIFQLRLEDHRRAAAAQRYYLSIADTVDILLLEHFKQCKILHSILGSLGLDQAELLHPNLTPPYGRGSASILS